VTYTSLRAFLHDLERSGELVRITAPVEADLEAPALAIRVLREDGPALLFENVRGASCPLLMNLFGTSARVTRALGCEPGALGEMVVRVAEQAMPPSPLRLARAGWSARALLPRLASMRLRRAWRAPVMEASEAPDLTRFPVVTCWPGDAGRFLTYPLVITRSPRSGRLNAGVYRMQQFAPDRTGMHIQIERGGGAHYAEAEAAGEPLRVAVAIGADPALLIAAIAPLPENVDELTFSGFLRGAPLAVTRGRVTGLPIPAHAEIVLEGEVPPHVREMEGPFGDHFGHYSLAAPFPVYEVHRAWHRRTPIYHATVVGKPPQEDQPLGDAVQEITAPLLTLIHPEVRSVWAYYEAGFHNLLAVQVRERYGREGLKAAFGLLGQGQLSLSKVVILVGPETDPRDPRALLRALAEHFDPSEDAHIFGETALDTLDFTSFRMHRGSKLVLDAIPRPARSEGGDYGARATACGPRRALSGSSRAALDGASLRARVPSITRARLIEDALLAVSVPLGTAGRPVLETLLATLPDNELTALAVVSDDVDIESRVELLWGMMTRFDVARDVLFSRTELRGAMPVHRGILGVDATWKPGYPEPLVMTPEIERRVDGRWREYFPR
jgi:4-hydroxy-3-polyprenylbenzoate decarboxylase